MSGDFFGMEDKIAAEEQVRQQRRTVVRYGCYECLRGHDGPIGVDDCPFCGGTTGPMPADEQPTRDAVWSRPVLAARAWWRLHRGR